MYAIEKFIDLKRKTLFQEQIKETQSILWNQSISSSKEYELLKKIYENENSLEKEFLEEYTVTSHFNVNETLEIEDYISLSDKKFRVYLENALRNKGDDYINTLSDYMKVPTYRPLHEDNSIFNHGIKSAQILRTTFLKKWKLGNNHYKDIKIALRIGMLIHDIGKVYNQEYPGIHNYLGVKFIKNNPSVIPNFINEQQLKLIEWILKYHDVFGRFARGIARSNILQLKVGDYINTSYNCAIDLNNIRQYITHFPMNNLSYNQKLEILINITYADVRSVPLLSRGVTTIPYIFKLLSLQNGNK